LIEKFGFAAFRRDPGRFWKEEPLVVASIALARLEPQASTLAEAHWDMPEESIERQLAAGKLAAEEVRPDADSHSRRKQSGGSL
jgi:hypothetical protein